MIKIEKFLRKYHLLILILVLFAVFFGLSLHSKGTYGGADDFVHYRFARWAFIHPYLFLDHWGKPVFTIITSVFAQFGWMGMKTFNLLTGLGTAYIIYLICNELNLQESWISILFICFTPVYLSMLISGMTEILFGFILILSIFLAFKNSYIWAAIILSLLPFVRNEGIVIFPAFILWFVMNKKYLAVPFLFTGFLFFSVLGYGYYHDIFWVINRMPYTGEKDIYGSGSLFHFVQATKSIFGIPLAVLFVLGFLLTIIRFAREKLPFRDFRSSVNFKIILLIAAPFAAYYFTHSFLWWKGLGGSLGLTRVMAGISPPFVVVAMVGFSEIESILLKKWMKRIVLIVFAYEVISTPFHFYKFPVPLDETQMTIRKAALWVKKRKLDTKRVYYYDPYYCFITDVDPYNRNKVIEKVPDPQNPSKDVSIGSIIVWDAHFGPQEGRLPVSRMLNDSLLQLIRVFRPQIPIKVDHGINYEVCIFQRMNHKCDITNNRTIYQRNITSAPKR